MSTDTCNGNLITLLVPLTGRSKGWGIVEFETPEEVGVGLLAQNFL